MDKEVAVCGIHNGYYYSTIKNEEILGFPGGAVVKNPPANAGDTGSSPGPGRSPHATEQLSPCTITTKPVL